MSSEQIKIEAVESKLNAISEAVDRLTLSMGEVVTSLSDLKKKSNGLESAALNGVTGNFEHRFRSHALLRDSNGHHHKDILEDDGEFNSDSSAEVRALAPEIQVQRLTAQLTAAYSRIAALEEQLLARRMS